MSRAVIPIMKKSSTALGEELVKIGVNLVKDVWKHGDLSAAQKKRGKELITNISNRVSDHMFGGGYSGGLDVRQKQLERIGTRKKTRKVNKKRGRKKTTKPKESVKSRKKTVKRKRTVRSKQNIQDIFT